MGPEERSSGGELFTLAIWPVQDGAGPGVTVTSLAAGLSRDWLALRESADASRVTLEARTRDLERLERAELDGASLITAAALLDMLTATELERLVASCADAACPTLSAASEVRPGLGRGIGAYEDRRLADAAAGRLRVTVHHCDLLAWLR